MPTHYNSENQPIVQFDPSLEISPFTLFRRLQQGRTPMLLDTRNEPGDLTLEGAEMYPGEDWEPPADRDVVLFDRDGSESLPHVLRHLNAGHTRVKMLFGGLDLYEFSLDPQIIGSETYLVAR